MKVTTDIISRKEMNELKELRALAFGENACNVYAMIDIFHEFLTTARHEDVSRIESRAELQGLIIQALCNYDKFFETRKTEYFFKCRKQTNEIYWHFNKERFSNTTLLVNWNKLMEFEYLLVIKIHDANDTN